MPIARSTIVGASTGVLLLAGAVAFGVGLPKAVGDGDTGSSFSGELPTLPDRLDDRMVALSSITPEDAGATEEADRQTIEQIAQAAAEGDQAASDNLTELYGAAVVRAYIDGSAMTEATATSAPAQMSVTLIPGDPGLVVPSGPFEIDQNGSHYELQEVGGHTCAVAWAEPTDPATGAPSGEPTAADYQAECRAAVDGITVDVYATGLAPEEVASYVDLVVASIEG
jgi:hypothetical protein